MAQEDWTELTGSLGVPSVARAATPAIPPPSGLGVMAFVMNSRVVADGAVAYFVNDAEFSPTAGDQAIEGLLYRDPGASGTGVSCFLYVALQGTTTNSEGYLLGLSDGTPSRLILAKRSPQDGLPNLAPDARGNGILMRGTREFPARTWVQVRLEVTVNDNGDVFVAPQYSDLALHAATAPSWETPDGMEGALEPAFSGFLDDAAQLYTGSAPFTAGRIGFGAKFTDISRVAAFDDLRPEREV